MKKIFYFLVTLLVLVVLGFTALRFFLSAEFVERKIVEAVRDQTGRSLSIGDGTRLSFFPSIGISLNNVTLSNPPDMADGDMLQARSLRINLELLPLLKKHIKVDEFILDRPIIALAVDRQGRANWNFASGAASVSGGERADAANAETTDIVPDDILLGDIRIINGILGYADAREGSQSIVKNIFISVSLPSLGDALEVDGRFEWKGRTVKIESWVKNPRAVLAKEFSPARLNIAAKGIEAVFDGNITIFNGVQADGSLSLKTPSVRDIAGWLGAELPTPKGFGAFSMTSNMDMKGNTLALSNLQMMLDGMKAEGGALVKTGGERPVIEATLAAGTININTYVAGNANSGGGGGGDASQSGWSNAPIDMSGLGALDADLRLSAAKITYNKIKIGKSALALTLNNGVLKADLGELQLYQGRASGRLALDGRRKTPAFSANITAEGVEALGLLGDAVDFNWVSGRGAFSINIASAGRSQRQMISMLRGSGNVKFENGAIEGINVAQMIRRLKKGSLQGWSRGAQVKTDFSILTGSFKISDGIVSNRDLKMIGPLVRLQGSGIVDLPGQWLDYKARPKLVASLKGQGGREDRKGLVIPVKIKGPWDNPKIIPDLKAMLEDPEALVKGAKSVVKKAKKLNKTLKKLKKGKAKDLIEGLINGDAGGGDDPVGGFLKNLMKQ